MDYYIEWIDITKNDNKVIKEKVTEEEYRVMEKWHMHHVIYISHVNPVFNTEVNIKDFEFYSLIPSIVY